MNEIAYKLAKEIQTVKKTSMEISGNLQTLLKAFKTIEKISNSLSDDLGEAVLKVRFEKCDKCAEQFITYSKEKSMSDVTR